MNCTAYRNVNVADDIKKEITLMLTDTNTVLVNLNVYVFYKYLAYLISYNKTN